MILVIYGVGMGEEASHGVWEALMAHEGGFYGLPLKLAQGLCMDFTLDLLIST